MGKLYLFLPVQNWVVVAQSVQFNPHFALSAELLAVQRYNRLHRGNNQLGLLIIGGVRSYFFIMQQHIGNVKYLASVVVIMIFSTDL